MTGKPHYRRWADVPEGLATKTTLSKEGLKPKNLEDFVATVSYDRGRETAKLYLRSETIEKRKVSAATRQKLSEAHERTLERKAREEQEWQHQHEMEERRNCLAAFAQNLPEDPRERRILDTETTDLDGEVISVTVLDGWGTVLLDHLIRPACGWISEGAYGVHGISMEMLADKPTFGEVWQELHGVLRGKEVYAFNSGFDRDALRASRDRAGISKADFPFPRKRWHCLMGTASAAVGDAVWKYADGRAYLEDFCWPKLEEARVELARMLHHPITPYAAHTSLGDAKAAVELLWQLVAYHQYLESGNLPKHPGEVDPYSILPRKLAGV